MAVTLGELAVRFGLELRGDPAVRLERVATLANAGPGDLSFLANPRYRAQLTATRAAAVIVNAAAAPECPAAMLVSENPYATYARIAALLYPTPPLAPGVHPSAIVAPGARIDASAEVGPQAVIGPDVSVGPRAFVGPHCVIAAGASLAEDVRLVARVTLGAGVEIGARVVVQPGAVIGGDGFGFAPDGRRWVKVPQVAHTAIAACTGISGSTTVGARCMIGGHCGFAGHINIADDVVITGYSMISRSIERAGVYSSGIPFEEARVWRRLVARFKRLPLLEGRLRKLEQAAGLKSAEGQEPDDD
jgi:UDP-3-O-[3-hydroxymyristoyl] glucosamine N-acyltransferase